MGTTESGLDIASQVKDLERHHKETEQRLLKIKRLSGQRDELLQRASAVESEIVVIFNGSSDTEEAAPKRPQRRTVAAKASGRVKKDASGRVKNVVPIHMQILKVFAAEGNEAMSSPNVTKLVVKGGWKTSSGNPNAVITQIMRGYKGLFRKIGSGIGCKWCLTAAGVKMGKKS
jgi:hypothetical protein